MVILGGTVLGFAGDRIMGTQDAEDLGHTGGFIGIFVGLTVGSSLGVYIIGDTGNETGSYGATLLGSTLGTGMATLLFMCIPVYAPELWPLLIGSYFWSPLGAVIGFNMTRRYKTLPASGTAFINFRDGEMSLAVPTVYFRPNPFDRRTLIQNADLVKVKF